MPEPIYPRSLDDKILSGIEAKITAQRDADVLVHAGFHFDIERDKTTPWQDLTAPLAALEQETDDPAGRDYKARYRVLCIVPILEDDELASKRLYILKEQVRKALLKYDDPDFGQSMGDIGQISKPAWSRVNFDDRELEQTVLAGSWSMEITYNYVPQDIDGPALDEIHIAMGRFSALYQLGGQS
jgi:hypothetical protein